MEKTEEKVESRQDTSTTNKLIMYNDDVNSFETVITALNKCLGYPPNQAEQLAVIAHHRGRAILKEGTMEELLDPMIALTSENITVEIQ